MEIRDATRAEGLLQEIVGRQLSSVEFVQDYLQLRFDGPTLTAVTLPTVEVGGREIQWGDPGYRDELCARIARKVVSARIRAADLLRIVFDDGATVKVSLRDEDRRAAEAVKFDLNSAEWWVL